MTIFGALALSWDAAILWADSDVYNRGEVIRQCNKLIVSPLAGILAAGTGSADVLEVGDRAVLDADDLDHLADFLPGRLLRAAAKATDKTGRRHADLLRNRFVAAGFSRSAGRVLVYVFDAWGLFSPVIATSVASPTIEFSRTGITDLASIVPIARRQMAIIREENPTAAGSLCAAHLGPNGLFAARVYDFRNETLIPPIRLRGASGGDAEGGRVSIPEPPEAHFPEEMSLVH